VIELPVTEVYLPPGLLHAGVAPCVITTVLGSCVSVSLWDRRRRAGGMNHFLMPRTPGAGERSPRHGDTALDLLLARLEVIGCDVDGLDARVHGGASVLGRGFRLGEENVELAFSWLRHRGIPVVDDDVLGTCARRIHFDVGSGAIRMTKVGRDD
jgi:chemotaxis protein CheD